MPFDDTNSPSDDDLYETISMERTASAPETVHVDLEINDPMVVASILALPRGRERDLFVERALRIGVLAINQAAGQIDTHALRDEGGRLVHELTRLIDGYRERTNEELEGVLKNYFNPQDGRFTQNVERLVRKDGDLERVLREHVESSQRGIKQTIDQLVGQESPIVRLLNPGDANTFFNHLTSTANQVIQAQNEKILEQFSLDVPESALNRLVSELSTNHASVGTNLQEHITRVMREFSLDEENSALNRMLRQIQTASEQIQGEFTLDNENSALARVRRELRLLIEEQNRAAQDFQERITNEISALNARRQEARQGVQHGHDFETAVVSTLAWLAEGSGDEIERVGGTVGEIPRCRVGDAVITLSQDSAAPGVRIVIEAKEAENYSLASIREEMSIARENRKATYGVFVLSANTALAESIGLLRRFDQDIVVVWNAEDRNSDIALKAAMLMAKGLVVRAARESEGLAADLDAMDRAVATITRQLGGFDEVNTTANTIKNGAERILTRTRLMRERIEAELEQLTREIESLKQA